MSSVGDLFELQAIYQDIDNKVIQNTYFYRYDVAHGLAWSSPAEALADAWFNTVWAAQRPATAINTRLNEVRVRNLFDGSDVWDYPAAQLGTRVAGTEYLPSHDAAKVTLTHTNGLIKKGRKMFAGLLEGDQAIGVLTLAGMAPFAVLAASCLLQVADSMLLGTKSFRPVVVKRVPVFDLMTGEITSYRLPTSAIEGIYGYIVGATLSSIVTTQTSRKS